MKTIANWLLMAEDGSRVSKTKLSAIVFAALNLCQAFGWTHLTPDQLEAVNLAIGTAGVLSLRDGMTASKP